MPKHLIDAKRLRELLNYDPGTGVFTRKMWRGGTSRAGSVAGSNHGNGHLQASIDGRLYFLHRLAWLYMTGEWPKHNIDHINGDPGDNRFANLRDVPQAINCQNVRAPRNRNGLPMGVRPKGSRFLANITTNGHPRYLGCFTTPEAAHAAYVAAKRELHAGCTI